MSQPNLHFSQTQQDFATYIRDPDNAVAIDNIETRRMKIYSELFYNNVQGFAASAFPVIRQLLGDEVWHEMVRDFMITHHCKTPLFHEISREFLDYLNNERDTSNDPIFIKELAHYEWVELALSFAAEDYISTPIEAEQDCLDLKLSLSPLALSLAYHYPVHQISPAFQPDSPADNPVFLLAYRNDNDAVVFVELNPVSARLLDLINNGFDGLTAAQQIADEMQHPNPEIVIDGARSLINDWLAKGVLI